MTWTSRGSGSTGLAAVLIVGCVMLSACGNEREKDQISVLYYAGLPLGSLMRAEIPAFTDATGIEVDFQELPYDAVRQRQVSAIRERLGVYDAIFVDDIWMYEYVRKGYLRRLTDLVKSSGVDMGDFFASVRAAEAELDGEIWLMPQRADVQVLFYRTDLFSDQELGREYREQYGESLQVPDTWEDYARVGKFFSSQLASKRPRIWGHAETLKRPHFAFEFFAMRYWSFAGRNFFSEEQAPLFGGPEGVRALTYLASLRDSAAPGSANAAHDETISAFAQGQVAMAPQWYAFYASLKDQGESGIAEKFDVARVPGVVTDNGSILRAPSIGGGSLGIPVDAQNPDAAWKFILWMTGQDFLGRAALEGAIVPRRSAYENPEVERRNPAVREYLRSLEQAWFRPRLEEYAEIESIIGRAVSRAYVGEALPEEALKQAMKEVESVFRRR